FALGVVVGKRLTRAAISEVVTDPLSLLDQVDTTGEGPTAPPELSFPAALSGDKEPPVAQLAPPEPEEFAPAKPQPEVQAPAKPVAEPAPKPEVPSKPAPKRQQQVRPDDEEAVALVRQLPQLNALAKAERRAKSKSDKPKKAAPVGKFTLQLSSFQDRVEAELCMKKQQEAGLSPYLLPAEIPGRGTWYRVRLGKFDDWQEALDAKASFEKGQQSIAYVARL
ncbi:MAG: SPOR domain-containing protein, partial [Myxococcales bacterium]|nr:SPOR domain-containing protein [Myxococcales bacterium]